MSTADELVKDALSMDGAYSIAEVSNTESLLAGLRVLKSMLQRWQSKGIMLKFSPPTKLADEVNEPLDARNAIISNLAVKAAPFFDNGTIVVSAELKDLAKSEYNDIKDLYQDISIPKKVASSTLPKGAGNTRGCRARTYNGVGGEVGK